MKDLFNFTSTDSSRFLLSGDLNQMSIQRNFLINKGFEVLQNNVYPSLKPADTKRALTLIWTENIAGWWHYQKEYAQHVICSAEEFKTKLNRA